MPSLEICFSGQKLAVFGDRNFGGARHFLECGRHPSRVLGWFLLDLRCWARGAGQEVLGKRCWARGAGQEVLGSILGRRWLVFLTEAKKRILWRQLAVKNTRLYSLMSRFCREGSRFPSYCPCFYHGMAFAGG